MSKTNYCSTTPCCQMRQQYLENYALHAKVEELEKLLSQSREAVKEWDDYGYLDNDSFAISSDDYNAWRSHPALIADIERDGS